nr:FHA domain-containing protein [Fimbriiglobus ruber]
MLELGNWLDAISSLNYVFSQGFVDAFTARNDTTRRNSYRVRRRDPTCSARRPLVCRSAELSPRSERQTVCDDGQPDGETVRLRTDRFVIGRTEGDLCIPHDGLISTRHVEISRQLVGGTYRWVVTDLQSTNGLYVRVTRTPLSDRGEIIVGRGRYRYDGPAPTGDGTVDHLPGDPTPTGSTVGWGNAPSGTAHATLTELISGGIGNRVVLTGQEYWIGTDPTCAIRRPDDPFCESRHVRLYRNSKGGWTAEHPKTANGLWVKVDQVVADAKIFQFQIGEQRFRLRT